jgi:predicted DNA-binding ribbon-helix-helix protein
LKQALASEFTQVKSLIADQETRVKQEVAKLLWIQKEQTKQKQDLLNECSALRVELERYQRSRRETQALIEEEEWE